MPEKYTSEQFWKLYEKLPQELKDALFAEGTSEAIEEVAEKYKLSDNQVSILVDSVGQVLLGVLPLEDFQKVLEKELKLKEDLAKKVFQEIYRLIFYPVRSALEELYKIEITPPTKPTEVTPMLEVKPPIEEKPEEAKRDIYREPIE